MDKRDTKRQDTRRRHSDALKRELVERSLVPGASVAAIALEAGVNANLLFNWRRLHLQGLAPDRWRHCGAGTAASHHGGRSRSRHAAGFDVTRAAAARRTRRHHRD